MDYCQRINFSGNPLRAIELARSVLMNHGFRILPHGDLGFEAEGPSMLSTKQNPLVGVSRAHIWGTGSSLCITAEFGGIKKMERFLVIFISAMAFFFVALGTIVFQKGQSFAALAPLLVWPILIPYMTSIMRRRTSRALDILLSNMAAQGRDSC